MSNSYQKIKDFMQESTIFNKRAIAKFKQVMLLPFWSKSLVQKNTPINQNIFIQNTEISIEDLCYLYPQRVKNLLARLDLDKEELEIVKKAAKKKDLPAACEALITYYRNCEIATCHSVSTFSVALSHQLSQLSVKPGFHCNTEIEQILNDTFTFQRTTARVPRCDKGLLDWSYTGPENDKEWAWFLNRHYHLLDLFTAYQQTGDITYVNYISNHITDWILSNPSARNRTTWAQWRGLEVAFRIFHWSSIFYGLQQVDAFTPVARILILSSILDHTYYLRYLHSWGANWITREMNALATAAIYWPEFKASKEWLNYATARMVCEINEQVYPDGVHKELTSHYHSKTLEDFQNFVNLLTISGKEIPPYFKAGVERMWNFLAYSMQPDGHGLLNNDSDRDYNRPLVREAANLYQRADWSYIATNGKIGKKPKNEPSTIFPWAGQVIMRSGWDELAHWSFFDIGPLGIFYHVHYDKLHLSIAAYGRDLLVDSGRYRYVRDKFWQYFRASDSHNVILIDSCGQKTDIKQSQKSILNHCATTPEFDFAKGLFNGGFKGIKGKATHSRAVVYLRNKYWVVIDHIYTDRPRKIEALWHFHPDCTVAVDGKSVSSIDADVGNLKIEPISNLLWTVKVIKGQESPIQGWWSREYNHIAPNPTAIYSTEIRESTTFVWVLVPAKGVVQNFVVHQLKTLENSAFISIKIFGEAEVKIAVRMIGNEMIDLGEGFKLDGDCAILQPGKKPLVTLGRIIDSGGKIIADSNVHY